MKQQMFSSMRFKLTRQSKRFATSAIIMFLILVKISASNSAAHDETSSSHHLKERQPHFSSSNSENLQRVVVGRSVKFNCSVNEIGNHMIAWFHKDKRLLLALDNKTVAWKDRIQVSSQGNSIFFLQIDSVQLSDKGNYTCQLNTAPVQSQLHILEVVEPPQIIEERTTINVQPVKEYSSVELRCAADGSPKPVIKWRRESRTLMMPTLPEEADGEASNGNELDGQTMKMDERNKSDSRAFSQMAAHSESKDSGSKSYISEGEILRFDRVTRYDMGHYICIASNGIQPSISQRIFLPVSFPKVTSSTQGQGSVGSVGAVGSGGIGQSSGSQMMKGNSKQRKNLAPATQARSKGLHRSRPERLIVLALILIILYIIL